VSARSRRAASPEDAREAVRSRYGTIASGGGCCSSPAGPGSACDSRGSGCGEGATVPALELGYAPEELAGLPDGADLGLGCGNPTALLSLRLGEVVLDLGSGGGIDCFLAARRVGPRGRAIGVDMTPEMLSKARENARRGGYANVEFRLGEIEHLPVADASVDVVISNCVINLAPEKGPVYREAFRVLRPGGRLAISDVVATRPISARDQADPSRWSSCSSGALEAKEVKTLLRRAGFRDVRLDLKISEKPPDSLRGPASLGVVSADIRAAKPKD
jgi:arsenite methyltransferase